MTKMRQVDRGCLPVQVGGQSGDESGKKLPVYYFWLLQTIGVS